MSENIPKNTPTAKSKLIDTVKKAADSIDTKQVEDAANKLTTDVKNKVESTAGQIAGQVEGGMKSVTQKFDKFQNKLENVTVEGLVDDGVESIKGMATDMVTEAIGSAITNALGAKVSVTFSEPDSNGIVYPITSSLEEDGGVSGTVAAILQLITGLGIGSGSLTKALVEGGPEGLIDAGKDALTKGLEGGITGKIGAFTSEVINTAVDETISSVTDSIVTTVTDAITAGTSGNINNVIDVITAIDSDGAGGLSLTRVSTTGTQPDALTEFNAAIDKVKTNPLIDIARTMGKDKETRQDLSLASSDLQNLTGGKNGDDVLKSVQDSKESIETYTRITNEKRSLVRTRVANGGEVGIIQSLSVNTFTDISAKVIAFCSPNFISPDAINTVVNKSQGDARDFNDAVKLLEGISGKSYNVIKTFLNTIDTTITTSTLEPPRTNVFEDPYVIGSFEKSWKDGKGDPVFPYVSSVEELRADLRNLTREVTEFVTHWTETPTNKNIGSEEINKIHIDLGYKGIGYHYVIRRDGSIQRGRPLNIEGEHAAVNGHNKRSVGIVFVGGINVPTGTPNIQDFVSVQSLTRSQLNTFDHFCRAIYTILPGCQGLGHNDLDHNQNDPGFSVKDYVRANFDKESLFDELGKDPSKRGPLTIDQINEKRDASLSELLGF